MPTVKGRWANLMFSQRKVTQDKCKTKRVFYLPRQSNFFDSPKIPYCDLLKIIRKNESLYSYFYCFFHIFVAGLLKNNLEKHF